MKHVVTNFRNGKYPLGLFFTLTTAFLFAPTFVLTQGEALSQFTLNVFLSVVLLCLFVLLATMLLAWAFPRASRIFDSFMHSFALYAIITVIFFPVQAGVQDGKRVEISTWDIWAHAVLYGVCFLLVVAGFKSKKLEKSYRSLVAVLGSFLFIAGLALGGYGMPLATQSTDEQWRKSAALAPKDNIIVICLDMVQQDFAKVFFDENPSKATHFDGFTYFTNTASSSPYTTLSINTVLRGKMFTGETKAPSNDNLVHDFIRVGYEVSISSLVSGFFIHEKFYDGKMTIFPDNIQKINDRVIDFCIIACKRIFPFELPRRSVNQVEFGWISKYAQLEQYLGLIEQVHIDSNLGKRVLWFHTLMTHSPVRFTKDGAFSMDLTPDDVYGEVAYGLSVTAKFMDKLKEIGVYDDALIIVLSDHGFEPIRKMNNLGLDQYFLLEAIGVKGTTSLGQYRPLLMIKPPLASGIMKYSEKPAALIDLRNTFNAFMTSSNVSDSIGVNLLNQESIPYERAISVFTFEGEHFTVNDFASTENWRIHRINFPINKQSHVQKLYPQLLRIEEDLNLIRSALERYFEDHGAYPVSENYDGLHTKWGQSREDWIQGLIPCYLTELPRDPRLNSDPDTQYLYKSDGKDYKLLSHLPPDFNLISKFYPALIDPKRPEHAFGYWTKGAEDW